MDHFKGVSADAHIWLTRLPIASWARHAFDPLLKNDHITNNLTESFNNWVDNLRGKPIFTMLDGVRSKLMSRIRISLHYTFADEPQRRKPSRNSDLFAKNSLGYQIVLSNCSQRVVPDVILRMYDNLGTQPGVPRPPTNSESNPFGNAFYGAGSGLIRGGLGAYGEKFLGSSSEYVQSNISRYFSDPQYYFQVNDHYVRNKLKVVLFPFLHRGHWTRITEPVGGRLSYKPPIYDINAPDLYIPLMVFGTYVVLAGFSMGLHGKFSPEALSWLFMKGLVGWFLQVLLLKMSLLSLGSAEAPLLDIVAYAGYTFTGMCFAVLGRILWSYSYYFLMPWTCLCMGVFLVKTMKRVLFAEVRSSDSSKHHYLLLFIALAQFPLFIWLGNIGVHWLF
ncbi:hypothetical protein F0562_006229 [Nyssa sinensis]|uniref:Yip1 domain-containing protein n=1 Tax=Nyssa sinensis TaxID=561372 RepID=A0A5J5AMI4_9ASTE|nr:hypothetical protein F0562_006229 [Nyssa sinensis]